LPEGEVRVIFVSSAVADSHKAVRPGPPAILFLTPRRGREYPFLVKNGTNSELNERDRGVARKGNSNPPAMDQSPKEKMSARLEKIPEYSIGLILLSKGWDEVEHFSRFPVWVAFIFLAAVFVIVGTMFHDRLERKVKNSAGLFHILEGVVEIICATVLLEKGKHWLPIFLVFLGLCYLSGGLVQFLTGAENLERAQRRLRIFQAIAFIIFAVATSVFNSLADGEPMVYLTDGVFVAAGIFILAKKGVPRKRIGLAGRIYDRLGGGSSGNSIKGA
jgi:hypothetical protein